MRSVAVVIIARDRRMPGSAHVFFNNSQGCIYKLILRYIKGGVLEMKENENLTGVIHR
jgi:hypothetical protein